MSSNPLKVFLFLAASLVSAQVSVTTQHNDIGRTGQNTQETILTPANVASSNFGSLGWIGVDGSVLAQPLYLPGIKIPSQGTHNVLFVATEHDSVYAFDAGNGNPLWNITLLDAAHGAAAGATTDPDSDTGCINIAPEIGITGTPVIDPVSGTIYLVGKTFENDYPVQRLHALDITSGAEKFGGPVTIQASMPGSGNGSSGNVLKFDPKWQNQRTGLLLLNGIVYMGFGSHCDEGPWHGWVLGYNAKTLKQTGAFATTPNGAGSGVWMDGSGLAADVPDPANHPFGRMFIATGNGSFNATFPLSNTMNYGDDHVHLDLSNGALTPVDDFTPYNQASLQARDEDVASGGVLIPPNQTGVNPHILIQAGKEGSIYVVNRDNMGGYSTTGNNILQELDGQINGMWSMPAYWNGHVYFWAIGDHLKEFTLNGGVLSTSPSSISTETSSYPGSTPSISSNGTDNGIVWNINNSAFSSGGPAILEAHDAANVATTLYLSTTHLTRDSAGPATEFVVPTIANGKVYVPGVDRVTVYGLLTDFNLTASPTSLGVVQGATATDSVTVHPINGFTGLVAFSASGLPSGVTASFSPASSASGTLTSFTASSTAPVGSYTVTITGISGALSHAISLTLAVSSNGGTTSVNLSTVANVYGMAVDGTTYSYTGLDGAGYTYSANLLGSSGSWAGASFQLLSPFTLNAVTSAVIPLPHLTASSLKLLATGVNGNQNGQLFKVTYTDGTTAATYLNLSDWSKQQSSNSAESLVFSMPYRDHSDGTEQTFTVNLYGYSIATAKSKTLSSITLPGNSNVKLIAIAVAP